MRDSFGREITYLRLSVTELCNLRCRYCMGENGICKKKHEDMLSEDEMIRVVEAAARIGITKLRITGGEPLVKKNIVSICERAAKVPHIQEVCLTTNGTLLSPIAKDLQRAGVKRINLSLDTLDPEKYGYITRIGSLQDALQGLHSALSCGFEKIKINCVLVGGFNDNEIPALADLTRKYPLDVRFIELMPMVEQGIFGPESFVSGNIVLSALPQLQKVSDDGVASLYQMPGALGNIGLISPVTAAFCGQCNRLRVTADGMVKPCLHSQAELSLKGKTEEEMVLALQEAIALKPMHHEDLSYGHRSNAKRQMNEIGG